MIKLKDVANMKTPPFRKFFSIHLMDRLEPMSKVPSVGESIPAIKLRSVVLPLPEGP